MSAGVPEGTRPSAVIGGPAGSAVVVAGLVVAVLGVSTAAVLIRLADAHPLALAFWRSFLGALALAPAALRSRARGPSLERGQRGQMVAAGVLLALHFALWIASLSFTTVASAVVLVAMSSVFVAFGSRLFLGEPASRRTWAGLLVALAGVVLVAAGDVSADDLGARALLGDVLAFGGAAAVGAYLLVGRAARRRLSVARYGAGVYGVAAAVLLVACLVAGAPLAGYDGGTWLAIAGLVLGPQLLGHTVFNALLSRVTATTVAVATLAEPVGATLLALVVLSETPTAGFWLGAPFVLIGVWRASTTARRAAPRRARP